VIYGEHDRLFTPRVLRAARWRVLPRFGAGRNHLSCVYAGNVASAIVAAIDAPVTGFRAYNVTADAPPALTAREFFEALGAALGRRLWQIPIPPAAALTIAGLVAGGALARAAVSFATGDNPYVTERARRELGWTPQLGSRDALTRTVRWFLEKKKARVTPGP
jgi:nucleoside-diphosphate-sugar epimerase